MGGWFTRGRAVVVVAAGLAMPTTVLVSVSPAAAGVGSVGSSGEGIGSGPQGVVPNVAAGAFHTCALLNTGQVSCWGSDGSGQVGNGAPAGNVTAPSAPIALPGGTTATAITAGAFHACALLNTGQVSCWGDDDSGQVGNGAPTGDVTAPSAPIALPGGTTATAITAGSSHACALLNTGQVSCWGSDGSGQVGNGAATGDVTAPSAPIALPAGTTATAITAGNFHTCALLNTGQVSCWGSDSLGQVGNGAPTGDVTVPSAPIGLPAGTTATAITAGSVHTCALLNTGQVSCWGSDGFGQVGNGAPTGVVTAPSAPIALPGGTTATAITAGNSHTCALLNTGQVSCWGNDSNGQVGNGATTGDVTAPSAPIALPGGTTATAITAGNFHTCALLNTGQVSCWGSDSLGQVGNGAPTGDVTAPSAPIALPAGTTATAITAGFSHTCALLNTGQVSCWGSDSSGQVGNGAPIGDVTAPSAAIALPAGTTATAVTAGDFHSCALLNTGQVSCWGSDGFGQVGNGAPTGDVTAPSAAIALPAGTTATAVTAGSFHTCALLNTGQVSCWGFDGFGQVGNGAPTGDVTAPSAPIGLPAGTTATAITAGFVHSCALLNTGQVSCWGSDGFGQVGNGPAGDVTAPSAPIGLPAGTTATAVTAGDFHSCALLNTGQVSCWGTDSSGEVGNGATTGDVTAPSAPIALPVGTTATAITAGSSHTCALLNTGQVSCWGADFSGQVGNGAPAGVVTAPSAPIALPAGSTATAITAGGSHTCALLNAGQVSCWGFDGSGQVGNGAPTGNVTAPVVVGQPAAPVNFGGVAGDGQIALDWDAPAFGLAAIDHYLVGRTTVDATSCDPAVPGTSVTETSTTVTGLSNGTEYWFCVAAVNANGAGAAATTGPVTPSAAASAPTGLSAVASDRAVDLSWTPPIDDGGSAVTGYLVGRTTVDAASCDPAVPGTSVTDTSTTMTGLTNGTGYWFCVAAVNANGAGAAATTGPVTPSTVAPVPTPETVPTFVSLATPVRVVDSRSGVGIPETISGDVAETIAAGDTLTIPILALPSVPDNATSVVVNLTSTQIGDAGFFTLYACGGTRPDTSNSNFRPGADTANLTISAIGTGGAICLYTSANTEIVVDVIAYSTTGFTPTTPQRLADTRTGTLPAADSTIRVALPAGATHVINVTSTRNAAAGFLTVHDCDLARPDTSNLNYTVGVDVANLTIASADGELCVYTSSPTDIIIDHLGTLGATRALDRLVDTRTTTRATSGTTITIPIITTSDPTAAINLTATRTTTAGFATVHDCTQPVPNTSNLNVTPGRDIANLALIPTNTTMCVTVQADTDIIIDLLTTLT